MKKIAPVLLVSVFLLPLPSRAEIKAGSVEVSPFAGYTFFENQQNLENDFIFGGRLGYNITGHFGIEAVGEYVKTRVDDSSKTSHRQGQFISPIDDVEITSYHLDLLYHIIPEGSFNPFIAAGYGANRYHPEINDYNMSVINVGVGAKLWLADQVALRLDLRDNMIVDEWIHNPEATLGIVFAFGGKSAAAVEPVKAEVAPQSAPVPLPPAVKEKVVIVVAEKKAEEKVLVARVEPKVVVLAFADIHFDFDQSTLTPQAKTILKRDIKLLKENPRTQIRIAGYTSASGTEDYNQKLSERRAKAVQDYLIDEGIIAPARLATIGYGETNPANYEAAPTEIYSDEAKSNMRVLFEIVVQ